MDLSRTPAQAGAAIRCRKRDRPKPPDIRSVRENGWKVSGKLKKAFPMLEDGQLQDDIVASVRAALEGEPD